MKILGVAVIVLISSFGTVEYPIENLSQVHELISAPSFVPDEELYTHIAGGYFSSFDMKIGQLLKLNDLDNPEFTPDELNKEVVDGSIKINLTRLHYDSRFVYLPEGELILKNDSGDTEIFSMKKLDYIQIEGSDIPAYRLSAENHELNKKAILISTSIGTEIPVMTGALYIESEKNIECFQVRICGRNNSDQERHLCKKIESVSEFGEVKTSELSFGDNASEAEISMADKAFDAAVSVYQNMGFDLSGLTSPAVFFRSSDDWVEDVLPNTTALYNNKEKYILVTPYDSETFQKTSILGTEGNQEVYYSILFHEFCHHLNNWVNSKIAPHHDEFIACALQLATLSESLLADIQNTFGGLTFKSRNDITLLAYISTPKEFQVASYLYGSDHELQMKSIIKNSHNMVRDPFLVNRI